MTDLETVEIIVEQPEWVIEVAWVEALIEVEGVPGPRGRDGSVGSTELVAEAGQPLSGQRAVALDANGRWVYADPADAELIERCVGLTKTAGLAGERLAVVTFGEWTEPSWAFAPGAVYVGATGTLVQAPPLSGGVLRIGTALSATTLLVAVGPCVHVTN